MSDAHKQYIAKLLDNAASNAEDHRYRCKMAARGQDPSAQRGHSGLTFQQLLDEADAECQRISDARAWLDAAR